MITRFTSLNDEEINTHVNEMCCETWKSIEIQKLICFPRKFPITSGIMNPVFQSIGKQKHTKLDALKTLIGH